MNVNPELIQGSDEWLSLRKNKIGSSDASCIMGTSPWSSPYQLWCRKLGLMPEVSSNEAMRRGTELEPVARELFFMETGIYMEPAVKFHKKRSWQMSSLDGWNSDQEVALEIKCGGRNLFDQACAGVIPEYYLCQMQHQLSTLESEWMFYFVYFEGNGKLLEIKRDEIFISRMIQEESKFWDCLQNLDPPELTEKDYIEKEDLEWVNAANQWKQVKYNMKNLELQELEIRQQLIQLAGPSNCKGAGIRLSKVLRKGNIDYQMIPELSGVDLNKYRKQSMESYRITENR